MSDDERAALERFKSDALPYLDHTPRLDITSSG
jgi:hypothetical protein